MNLIVLGGMLIFDSETSHYQLCGFCTHCMQPALCDYSRRVGSPVGWDQPVVSGTWRLDTPPFTRSRQFRDPACLWGLSSSWTLEEPASPVSPAAPAVIPALQTTLPMSADPTQRPPRPCFSVSHLLGPEVPAPLFERSHLGFLGLEARRADRTLCSSVFS